MKNLKFSYLILAGAMILGIAAGLLEETISLATAEAVSTLFLNLLSMIAAPIVGLSILSVLLDMQNIAQMKRLGKKVLAYTLLTTTLASLVALGLFLFLDPVSMGAKTEGAVPAIPQSSYVHFLTEIIPSNIFKAFMENKVISIAFLGFLFGIAAHLLPQTERLILKKGFGALFQLFLKIAGLISKAMPIAIWAFMTLLVKELREQKEGINGIWTYLTVIVSANLVQGLIVIPILLKLKKISPIKIAKGGIQALVVAFFTKSSNATLPLSLKISKENLGIREEVANFALPLCTVINMNGCAAFILTTTLFVAGIHGHVFSFLDLGFWVLMSILAAVGNAGVPMGCFFLTSAFLVGMGIPLNTMGLILPFYSLIDMEETALNVWSDLSVASLVEKDIQELEPHLIESYEQTS